MNLYHGTSLRRLALIESSGLIETAPSGDMHVSFSSEIGVAAYFASISYYCDDFDEFGLVVLATTTDKLASSGLSVQPYSSPVWGDGECDWEAEYACLSRMPFSLCDVVMRFGPITRRSAIRGDA